jgi:uncharacterized protein
MESKNGNTILSASDLANHLACAHLTQLNRRAFIGEIDKPGYQDPVLEILRQRGQEHEARYVKHLRDLGKSVMDLTPKDKSSKPTLADTLDAMKRGYDIIVQARLENEKWGGYSDILIKREGKSKLGAYYYEVQDAKLSQETRAGAILQLCLYTEILSGLQDRASELMYIIKPGDNATNGNEFKEDKYRFDDYQSYYKVVKDRLITSFQNQDSTYPNPVDHCSICSWWQECYKARKADDHLSLVAGMRNTQIKELNVQEINTLKTFAEATILKKPKRGNLDSLEKRKKQAEIQYKRRLEKGEDYTKVPIFELLPVIQPKEDEEAVGLARLPKPSQGDIYFDFEGDAFYQDGSLEYLFGYVYKNEAGEYVYDKIWAHNRVEEKASYLKFIEFLKSRWSNFPGMCIYHFAPYEPVALKRLMRVHGAEEEFVDKLLRGLRFVDLHSILKETLIASVEKYSLKDLEKLAGYIREIDLREASAARRQVEHALQLGEPTLITTEEIQKVEKYNEDDCRATLALHDWIEKIREGNSVPHFQVKDGELKNENEKEQQKQFKQVYDALTKDLPDDKSNLTPEQKGLWLLANMLEYFKREENSRYWEFLSMKEMEDDELFEERKAIAYLTYPKMISERKGNKNARYQYSFEPQEVDIKTKSGLYDSYTKKRIGTLESIDREKSQIIIGKNKEMELTHPVSVFSKEQAAPYKKVMEGLVRQAKHIIGNHLRLTNDAFSDLLLKNKPRLVNPENGPLIKTEEDHIEASKRIAIDLDNSILAIQGPPGTGKTHTGAELILLLLKKKKKIGVTALSHKAIINLLRKVKERAIANGIANIKLMHRGKDDEKNDLENVGIELLEKDDQLENKLSEGFIIGGTAWLWADEHALNQLDYLIIDEAGQLALVYALAIAGCARNIIMLGDPIQLEQPQQAVHPEGSGVATLERLLDGHQTMPADQGIFIGTSRRLHPEICKFTSEQFYENKLHSLEGLEKQILTGNTKFQPSGLFYVPVNHEGNSSRSDEEIETVGRIINNLISSGIYDNKKITSQDILIVAPYNAQVNALKEKFPDYKIGTVDKFQGQEAPVVIYSMASSSVQDAPRGMNFLFDPNRFNVATSRALSVCILVAAPALFEAECKTVEQMKWANVLCRYKELSKTIYL